MRATLLTAAAFAACAIGAPRVQCQDTSGTLYAILEEQNVTTFLDYASRVYLNMTLKNLFENLTVLAPSNEAFKQLPSDVENKLENDLDLLTKVMTFHFYQGVIPLDADNSFCDSLAKIKSRVNVYDGKKSKVTTVSGVQVGPHLASAARNGLVYIVDKVMFPLPTVSALRFVNSDQRFTSLLLALAKTGTTTVLDGQDLTILAPSDEAFQHLPVGCFSKLLEDLKLLTEVLQNHIVHGVWYSAFFLAEGGVAASQCACVRECVRVIGRAQRLSMVREAYLAGKGDATVQAVTMEDLLIYLRWLVCHLRAMKRFNQYLRDLNSIHNAADEMEMFAAVNRKYKHFFIKQEHLLTFRMYDRVEEKRWSELRQADKVDEILRVMSHFLKVKDADKVQDTLKEHASMVHNPPTVQAVSVTSHRTPNNTRDTWRKIYTNPDLYTNTETDENAAFQDIDERDVENVNFTPQARSSSARRRKDSYDYVNTVQMLGLDDGEQNTNDPVTVHGSFLSFLHLRHLRIRDLQRTCLSVLNYFRSIERTLTINDGGLSMEGDVAKRTSISETEFIEFGEVENHDDFYTIDEGRVHVQDQRGYYIMYDSAVEDLKAIEKDLLLMATYFIEKDRDFRKLRGPDSSRRGRTDAGDFEIPNYAHQDVDRFGILLDIWTNEAAFLERKREELQQAHKPETVLDALKLEKQLLEVAQREWNTLPQLGKAFSSQLDKDLSTLWLSKTNRPVYIEQAKDMGYDAAHLNLRLVQFEYASHRPTATKPPPIFITAIQDNDSSVDNRDMMLNDFVAKKSSMGAVLRNPDELEKLKRKHISEFCDRFHVRMSHTSMRAQILAYYSSMLSLLEDFPSVRDTYFMMGEPNEKKTDEDSTDGLVPDPRTLKKRPRRLLSQDGRHVLNLWFIPHYTEALIMFKHLDDDTCYRALAYSLSIVSSLHDMLQYLCAFSRLGSSHARLGSRRMEFVSADWGGTEGVGSELREIQKHVDALPDPTDPTVVQELLWLRRDVLFLEFDTAVRHCMTDTFLSTGNMQAFKAESRTESRASHAQSTTPDLKDAAKILSQISSKGLHRSQQPMEAYRLLKFFLLLWKCVELAKSDWGKRKLGVESISTYTLYKEFCKHYRVEMLVPVLQSVARRLGQGEMYDAIIPETDVLAMPRGASEIEVRAKQLVRLFEALECHMIMEVMKESFTTNRPHVAEQFVDQLMSQATETESEITFSRDHLRECFSALGRGIMARERQNYESYTMYYENLLRTHHQLLYQSEQEVKQLKDQLREAQQATVVEVQCQMAARAHDLIMEITALRAKILEMREQSMTHEQDIRERVKKEFKDVIQNMFSAHFQLRTRFDEFRGDLRDDVFAKINETRGEAVAAMSKLAEKFGGSPDDDLRVNLSRAEQLRALQQENHQLSTLIIKMKAMHAWRNNHLTNNHLKTITDLRKDSEMGKKETLEVRMLAEEQVILLRQQLIAIKRALAATERESNEVRRLLDKELKIKQEKEHELMQKERSKMQLEAAKQASIERLVGELNDKDQRLRSIVEEQDRNTKLQSLTQEKVRKDVDTIKKQLTHERSLKLDAFHRVDELQSQVGGRLRSRIAQQLLNELEPDHHRTIVQLEQLQLEGRR
nr:hypothetical protein BaRGS_020053 [Batillaria attramentaria]